MATNRDLESELRGIRESRLKRTGTGKLGLGDRDREKFRAVVKMDRIVRRLLDRVGAVEWGRGFMRRKYQLASPSVLAEPQGVMAAAGRADFVWTVSHTVESMRDWHGSMGAVVNRVCEQYAVTLRFNEDGAPAGFVVEGEQSAATADLTETGLADALKSVVADGPMTEMQAD